MEDVADQENPQHSSCAGMLSHRVIEEEGHTAWWAEKGQGRRALPSAKYVSIQPWHRQAAPKTY